MNLINVINNYIFIYQIIMNWLNFNVQTWLSSEK